MPGFEFWFCPAFLFPANAHVGTNGPSVLSSYHFTGVLDSGWHSSCGSGLLEGESAD